MTSRFPIHFVDSSPRARAEFARMAMELGYHAEVYGDLAELAQHRPGEGVVVASDEVGACVATMLGVMGRAGVSLPLVAASEDPTLAKAVSAVKAGAIDYLALPFDIDTLGTSLGRLSHEIRAYIAKRSRVVAARNNLAELSVREREVLDRLSNGFSNKEIARDLSISPRTVEIHRANMMVKLGAKHVAAAVRLMLDAEMDEGEPVPIAS